MYYSYSPFDDMMGYGLGSGAAGALVGVLAVLYAVFSLSSIALYVLQSLGLFTAARRRGIRNYGLSWVPVAYLWILGSMADQYDLAVKGEEKGSRRKLVGLAIALVAVSVVGFILLGIAAGIGFFYGNGAGVVPGVLGIVFLVAVVVLGIILAVFQYIALYKFYMSCKPENAVVFLVFGIFFNILTPIFLFVSRNQDQGFPVREPESDCSCSFCEPEPVQVEECAAAPEELPEPAAEPGQPEEVPAEEE